MSKATRIVVARGDGIGPEIMEATLSILESAGAKLDITEIEVGEKQYLKGHGSGLTPETWDILRRDRILLKSPITTPQGGGYKSLNVTMRKTLGLYANVRPCLSYAPFVASRFPKIDLVIIRENEEDLYAGIEYRQTQEVFQCLKIITRPGCERIIRYAFEYARRNSRKHVTCLSKDNIMKMTDGLFHAVFNEIAREYPEITTDHKIIDIGTALIADSPERFDVIVTLNLYGDIISDVAAQVCGSVGIAGSANIGDDFAMFEAIHGSAPDIAGKGIANPSALLNGAVMMLVHIGQLDVAETITNAWKKTIEDGIHTGDIYRAGVSRERVGTAAFARAVIERLGQKPSALDVARFNEKTPATGAVAATRPAVATPKAVKTLTGIDVFLEWDDCGRNPQLLGKLLERMGGETLGLKMITNRGVKVYPDGFPETRCSDHWRCRFTAKGKTPVTPRALLQLLEEVSLAGLDCIKTENLYDFNGERGYSLGQGE